MSGPARHLISGVREFVASRRVLNIVRNVAIVLIILSAAGNGWAIRETVETQRTQERVQRDLAAAQRDVQTGRTLSLQAVCGALSAVIDAGRRVIQTPSDDDPPGTELRREIAAASYASSIASRIESITGRKDLVDPRTGALDCDRLQVAAKVR